MMKHSIVNWLLLAGCSILLAGCASEDRSKEPIDAYTWHRLNSTAEPDPNKSWAGLAAVVGNALINSK